MVSMTKQTSGKKRLAVTLAVIVCLVLVGFALTHSHLRLDRLETLLHIIGTQTPKVGDEATMTVRPQPISQSITLTGHIAPGRIENIPAPFTSTVKKISFTYNESVAKDEVLLELDTGEIQTQLWDAESAYLLAKQNYEKIINWESSTDVQSARQQLDGAQEELTTAQKKMRESKMLYDKGIVSGNEYDSSVESLHTRQRALQTTKANLHAIFEKGSQENIERTRLQLNSAREKRDSLQKKIAKSVIRAPFDGVTVMPYMAASSEAGGGSGAQPHRLLLGSRVNSGDPLLGTANLETYSVETKVDEIEISKLQLDQPVAITGEAFPDITLDGRVDRISQEADASQNSDNLANFKVWVTISQLTVDQRRQLRIGMTAHMNIITYTNSKAIVLPPSALQGGPGQSWVLLRSKDNAEPERIEVTTGITTLDGVEILSGLRTGDMVILNNEYSGP